MRLLEIGLVASVLVVVFLVTVIVSSALIIGVNATTQSEERPCLLYRSQLMLVGKVLVPMRVCAER